MPLWSLGPNLEFFQSVQQFTIYYRAKYIAAFAHANVKDHINIEMPLGFHNPGKLLKLKKSIYGLQKSPRNFLQQLKSKFAKLGFR